MASLASSGVVLLPPGALRLSTSSACPALLPAVLLAVAAFEPSAACTQHLALSSLNRASKLASHKSLTTVQCKALFATQKYAMQ